MLNLVIQKFAGQYNVTGSFTVYGTSSVLFKFLILFAFKMNYLLLQVKGLQSDFIYAIIIDTVGAIVKRIILCQRGGGGMAGVLKTCVWLMFSCIHCLFWIPVVIVTISVIWGYYVYVYLINITAAGEGGT